MKKLYLALASFFLVASIISDVEAWDSRIVDNITNIEINWFVITSSTWGIFNPAGPRTIATNWSTVAYWGWFPVAYFIVTDANNEEFTWSGREVFSPLIVTPSGIAFCIIKSIVGNEYRVVNAGKTYIPGEGTQVDTCFDSPDFSPIGTIPEGFRLIENWDNEKNPEAISGLECTIVRQPIASLTQWYTNYGSLSERIVTTWGGNIIQTGSGAWGLNFDAFAIIGANSGATLPIGSITYTWSTYADIWEFPIGGQPSTLYWYVKRDGAFAGWNVLQIHGVNTSGFFWKYGILRGVDGTMKDRVVYSSGSTATAYLENGRVGSTWNIFSPISGFSGFRVGYAPYGDYRSCSKKWINSCEWRIEGGSNVCAPKIAYWFEVGICGITGSGSVYWSGSCVPLTGSGGDIIDAGILPGQGMVITLPDGTTKLVRIPEGYNSKVFTCPNSIDEHWYRYIFRCAGEVIGNILDAVTGESKELIYSQVWTFSNERVYQGSFSGLLENIKARTNPLVGSGALLSDDKLILALKQKLDTIWDPGPNIWERMFTGTFALFSLLVILAIIGFIIRAFRQDMDDIPPPQNRS